MESNPSLFIRHEKNEAVQLTSSFDQFHAVRIVLGAEPRADWLDFGPVVLELLTLGRRIRRYGGDGVFDVVEEAS
jgi:hypothetical protein